MRAATPSRADEVYAGPLARLFLPGESQRQTITVFAKRDPLGAEPPTRVDLPARGARPLTFDEVWSEIP